MILSGGAAFIRASSLPAPETIPRRSFDISVLGCKSRRVSVDTRATDIDLACLSSANLARAERNGVTLEVGRSVDVDEQRQRLERTWNTEEQTRRDQESTSNVEASRTSTDASSTSPSRQRLERRWSAQHGQTDPTTSSSRSSSTRSLRSMCQARRSRLKGRIAVRSSRLESTGKKDVSVPLPDRNSAETQEEADQLYLRSLAADLHQRRAKQAGRLTSRCSDRNSLGSLDSWGDVGLLSREAEYELGRMVQSGLAIERTLQGGEEAADREVTDIEQAECMDVPDHVMKLRMMNKDAAHQLLVQYNLRLLGKVAKKYRGRGMDVEDLIVEGARGLARAIEGFDPAKGNRFSTYAYMWIRQSIGRCISEDARVVRLPIHVLEAIGKIQRVRGALSARSDEPVTHRQIAGALGISEEKVDLYVTAAAQPRSLDEPVSAPSMRADHEGDQTLEDIIEDGQPSADDILMQNDCNRLMKLDVDSVLEGLPLRERNILRCRYGLHTGIVSLSELSHAYGLSKERVRQIGEVALSKLQRRQASNGEDLQNGRKQKLPTLKPQQYAGYL